MLNILLKNTQNSFLLHERSPYTAELFYGPSTISNHTIIDMLPEA
jgi:hypothetical protein